MGLGDPRDRGHAPAGTCMERSVTAPAKSRMPVIRRFRVVLGGIEI